VNHRTLAVTTMLLVCGCGASVASVQPPDAASDAGSADSTQPPQGDATAALETGPSDSPSDAGSGDSTQSFPDGDATVDSEAGVSDSGCQPLVVLLPDAAPHTCAFTPADVACNVDSDCDVYVAAGCGCFDPAFGVNRSNTGSCPAPPCVPLMGNPCPNGTGFISQDCKMNVSTLPAVACVRHVCTTSVAAIDP
jgi:hypothetical protein